MKSRAHSELPLGSHERDDVTYFVSDGEAAHVSLIERALDDPVQSKGVNYHYLLVEVDHQRLRVAMKPAGVE